MINIIGWSSYVSTFIHKFYFTSGFSVAFSTCSSIPENDKVEIKFPDVIVYIRWTTSCNRRHNLKDHIKHLSLHILRWIASTWVHIDRAQISPKWTHVFNRLATQRSSTQVGFSTGEHARLHWNSFFATCVELASASFFFRKRMRNSRIVRFAFTS